MATAIEATKYITINQVCEMIPGLTRDALAQLRFKGTGPRYYAPTPRKILYTVADVEEWMQSNIRTGTAETAR